VPVLVIKNHTVRIESIQRNCPRHYHHHMRLIYSRTIMLEYLVRGFHGNCSSCNLASVNLLEFVTNSVLNTMFFAFGFELESYDEFNDCTE
jgi:hypothetical protein